MRVGIPIADHRGRKAVSLPDHSFYETRFLRVVPKRHADFADRGVNAAIDIEEDVLAPKAFSDLLSGHQFPATFDQQDEQLHGAFFQAQDVLTPLESIAGLVEREIGEMKFLSRNCSHVRA